MPQIPLFPLQTVLFPSGLLPLRIFEPRYLDMVSLCLKEQRGFGVCLIHDGAETGKAKLHWVGTLAQIRDWSSGEDGLLHILARGADRFRIQSTRTQADGLNLCEVEVLPMEPVVSLPEQHQALAELLRQIMQQLDAQFKDPQPAYGDSTWVGYRLAEMLPLGLPQKQYLLELSDPVKRLEILTTLVQSFSTH